VTGGGGVSNINPPFEITSLFQSVVLEQERTLSNVIAMPHLKPMTSSFVDAPSIALI
jgi:hypothetical protein